MAAATAQDLPSSPPFQTSETGFFRHLVSCLVDTVQWECLDGNLTVNVHLVQQLPSKVTSPTRKRVEESGGKDQSGIWQIIWHSLHPLITDRGRLSHISSVRSASFHSSTNLGFTESGCCRNFRKGTEQEGWFPESNSW